jgi:uncharacterized protein YecE (DUF72 family)
MGSRIHIGTASWQVPKTYHDQFPTTGTWLERYAGRFNAVEINSTFYRLPRASTAERWAASVPPDFRFAVKLSKEITHVRQLKNVAAPMRAFADIMQALGDRAGIVLVQLPPRLAFSEIGEEFLHLLHEQDFPRVALEPRHPSWFSTEVNTLLKKMGVARVAADPPRVPEDGRPGGDTSLVYYRWHGSPRIYWTPYEKHQLEALANAMKKYAKSEVWVMFDNTAQGAATSNALELMELLR